MKPSLHFIGWLAVCLSVPTSAVNFYVSPTGADSNSGTSASQPFLTLSAAQQAVRNQVAKSITENVTVNLADGIYSLSTPLKFTSQDSGSNGFSVNWVGPGATISGGLKVTGWTAGSNGVYSANVPTGTKSRNLYVNGKASNFARKKIANRKDMTFTSTSLKWTSSSYDWMTSTQGIANAEVRFINSFTDRYAPIKSVGNKELVMKQNWWFNNNWGYDTVAKPNADFGVWVQNALALLAEGGQFYLDSSAGKVYYKPLSGEDMSTAETYLAILDTLVAVGGTYDAPAHDISFSGISFVSFHEAFIRAVLFSLILKIRHTLLGYKQQISAMLISRPEATYARTKLTRLQTSNPHGHGGAKCLQPSKSALQKTLLSQAASTRSLVPGAWASAMTKTHTFQELALEPVMFPSKMDISARLWAIASLPAESEPMLITPVITACSTRASRSPTTYSTTFLRSTAPLYQYSSAMSSTPPSHTTTSTSRPTRPSATVSAGVPTTPAVAPSTRIEVSTTTNLNTVLLPSRKIIS